MNRKKPPTNAMIGFCGTRRNRQLAQQTQSRKSHIVSERDPGIVVRVLR
jgi:hypothetical protein